MSEREKRILKGPWKGVPVFTDEQIFSDESAEADVPAPDFQLAAIPVAPSRGFLRIVASARREDILKSKISDEIRRHAGWSRAQLLFFVNNPRNHPILMQKPVLVLALHALIEQKRQ